MLKRVCLFVFFLLFVLSYPQRIFAADNITVSTDVTYTIAETGVTSILIKGTLTNKTADYYASSYKMQLGFKKIENVRASDAGGNIAAVVNKSDDEYLIDLPFNSPAVGLGKSLPFTLSFDTPDIAKKRGSIWEVNVPGIVNQTAFSTFTVTVHVPASFGPVSYVKPPIAVNGTTLRFTKDQLKESGISLAFGDKQTYGYTLTYHLKNTNIFPIRTEIALPPSTNYQEVAIDSISSKPTNVVIDPDGNWMASYTLLPSEKKDIVVKGRVQVSLIPKPEPMTAEALLPYLKEDTYWSTKNEKIKELAQNLKTPLAIYEYVVKNLKYDFTRVSDNRPRLGAAKVLLDPSSAVCLEFTDLFIALSRAAGIPAREVDGYGYTDNDAQRPISGANSNEQDILHAWPEYYDKDMQTWIMVDPTWGNTTGGVDFFSMLDFDHITFVRKGRDSEYPIPAGGYKLDGTLNTKDVAIFFSPEEILEPQNFQIRADIPSEQSSFLPLRGNVVISNIGAVALTKQDITIQSEVLSPKKNTIIMHVVPPYGKVTEQFSFDKPSLLTNKKDLITITVAGKTIYHGVRISPLTFGKWLPPLIGGIICAGIFGTGLFIVARRTWRLLISRRES